MIVAKDPGSAKKATSYAERLRLAFAVIHGEQKVAEADLIDGRSSPPPQDQEQDVLSTTSGMSSTSSSYSENRIFDGHLDTIPSIAGKNKPPMSVVGDVGGRTVIIVDDIIDDVSSFVAAAEALKEKGATEIFVLATHGLLTLDAPKLLEESPIDQVVVTNTGKVKHNLSCLHFIDFIFLLFIVPHEAQKLQCAKIKTVDISMMVAEAIRRIHNKESMSYLFRNVTLED